MSPCHPTPRACRPSLFTRDAAGTHPRHPPLGIAEGRVSRARSEHQGTVRSSRTGLRLSCHPALVAGARESGHNDGRGSEHLGLGDEFGDERKEVAGLVTWAACYRQTLAASRLLDLLGLSIRSRIVNLRDSSGAADACRYGLRSAYTESLTYSSWSRVRFHAEISGAVGAAEARATSFFGGRAPLPLLSCPPAAPDPPP